MTSILYYVDRDEPGQLPDLAPGDSRHVVRIGNPRIGYRAHTIIVDADPCEFARQMEDEDFRAWWTVELHALKPGGKVVVQRLPAPQDGDHHDHPKVG